MDLGSSHRQDEHRERLADLITVRSDEIQRRWLERVEAGLHGRIVSPSELRNSMGEYLARLADGLRQRGNVEAGGSSSWENVAREHAETRVRLGFDIDQLVHEFIVLRQVLFAIIDEQDDGFDDTRERAALADLIEGAIAAAVKSYVTSRDYEARKREAEHVGFITHELRNPLTTVVLGVDQLRRLPSGPRRDQTIELVERNLRRISQLIEGVLLVERGAHALKPQLSTMTLGELLEQAVAAAKLAAETKGLRIVTSIDPEIVVYVDSRLSTSAIDNVVQNAIKFTDQGEVEIGAEENQNEVVLHVRDTGPGISEENLSMIFEPFRRGSATKPGSGLGLAIARRAVEAQGGTIHAESDGKSGAHFWLTLPKATH